MTDEKWEALRAEAEKVQRAAWAEIHGQDPTRTYSVAEVKQLVYSFDNVLSALLRRSEVSTEGSERFWAAYRDASPANNTPDQRRAFLAGFGRSEPQGEPSDAQVNAFIRAINAEGSVLRGEVVRIGLRAAWGVR